MLPAVFMLGSAPFEAELLPLETNHAHNYFFHQWVELGILGFFASVGGFVISFLVGGMAAISMLKEFNTDEQRKAAGWVFVIVGIVTYCFIDVIIGIAIALASLFAIWKLGPLVIFWIIGSKQEIEKVIETNFF